MKRPRVFYGWWIVGVAFLSAVATMGVAGGPVYGFFLKPMSQKFGWTRTEMVFALTLGSLAAGAVSPLVGRVVDRYGARALMVIGGIITGALVMIVGRVNTLVQFYFIFTLGVVVARSSVALLVPQTAVINWFVRKRGRAVAISTLGDSCGQRPPRPADYPSYGYLRLAGCLGGHGHSHLDPRGGASGNSDAAPSRGHGPEARWRRRTHSPDSGLSGGDKLDSRGKSTPEESWGTKEALQTKAFWLILIGSGSNSLGVGGFIIHMAPYFTDIGLSAEAAAAAVVASAIGSAIGKISFWIIVERIHVRYAYAIQAFTTGITMAGLLVASNAQSIIVMSLLWGITMGGIAVLMTVVWPDYFGRGAAGAIRGYAMLFESVVMAMAPLFSAFIYDITGGLRLRLHYPGGGSFPGGCPSIPGQAAQKDTGGGAWIGTPLLRLKLPLCPGMPTGQRAWPKSHFKAITAPLKGPT